MLSQGECSEERIESRVYEIWKNNWTGEILTIPWEINSKYNQCPQCNFFTLELSLKQVLHPASYSSSGKGEQYDICHHCSYKVHKRFYTIAKKKRESSSSSSSDRTSSSSSRSSSSRSGSSRSSGGGSFGGGSSGGGGAGGRW